MVSQATGEAGIDEELFVFGFATADDTLHLGVGQDGLVILGVIGTESALAPMTAEEEDDGVVLGGFGKDGAEGGEDAVVGGLGTEEGGHLGGVGEIEFRHTLGVVLRLFQVADVLIVTDADGNHIDGSGETRDSKEKEKKDGEKGSFHGAFHGSFHGKGKLQTGQNLFVFKTW